MSTDKMRVSVLVSSCPDTTEKKWKPNTGDVRDVSREAFLVRIVPEKGRASSVFRLYAPTMVRMWLENDRLGNPYGIFGDVVPAFTGIAKFSTSLTVFVSASGNLWEQWNGKATSEHILKRSKFKASQRAFDVYEDGEEIDTVFYSASVKVDAEEVRRSLVDHDGYSPSIEVYEHGHGCPECKGEWPQPKYMDDNGPDGIFACPRCGFSG